ncbi:hypothetical protein KQ51_01317 [Candidatus Izimaplasma bacterium HR1]|uniref:hypothetical protein n=1 Tax=Candidatus Izimoplasma sp. HR1 TaxID=1541959 RepID=UPI0004F5F5C3|nr:hypothetical protein KQ51_01317 [Candidatus Izimaplasma bacterium HR1]
MSYKKRNPLRLPIIFTVLSIVVLILTILFGINLSKNELIIISKTGETEITITDPGGYYVLLDTDNTRYHMIMETFGVASSLTVVDDEDLETELYETTLVVRGSINTDGETLTALAYDKQVKTKDYLAFARVDFVEDTYTFTTNPIADSDDFGGLALLSVDYVARIGVFSLTAITTVLLSLLTFKQFRKVQQIPISKYQKKHLKK